MLMAAPGPRPTLVAVSGWAPQAPSEAIPSAGLPEADFIEAVRRLGGLPQEILDSPELLRMVLPALRADFHLCAAFRPPPAPVLDSPVIGYTGDLDPLVSPSQMANWRSATNEFLGVQVLRGDHFFLAEHTAEILTDFVDRLHQLLSAGTHTPHRPDHLVQPDPFGRQGGHR